MNEEFSLQQLMDVLRKQYGEGFQAGREEGHDIMADALRAELGITPQRAKELVRDLEAAHSIRWSERRIERGGSEPAPSIAVGGTAGTPVAPGVVNMNLEGYWQLS